MNFSHASVRSSACRARAVLFMGLAAMIFAMPLTGAAAPYALTGTEVKPLPRSANGRNYTLLIALPASYASHPERKYPVVYITDGYWDFHLLTWETGNLVVDQSIPECIVVGISYTGANLDYGALRQWDLTPGFDPYAGANSGHAKEFLNVIAGEFIPYVESHYRVNSKFRVLGGSSYGGLFTMWAMFEKPTLFQACIAVSPALWYQAGLVASRERTFRKSHGTLNVRVYLTFAGDESYQIRSTTRDFAQQLRLSGYKGLQIAVREIEGERHSGTKAEGFHRGLRFAFAPLAPRPTTIPNVGWGSRSPLTRITTRAYVATGSKAAVTGFTIDGPAPKTVLLRALGPALKTHGMAGALTDPKLTVTDSAQHRVASNDNWGSSTNSAALALAAARAGAISLARGSRDAAVLVTLEPGNYTVTVAGVNQAKGIAQVEIFEVLP